MTLLEKYIAKVETIERREYLRGYINGGKSLHVGNHTIEELDKEYEKYKNDNPEALSDIQSLLPELIKEVVEEQIEAIHEMTRKGRYFIKGESSKAGKYKNEGYNIAVKEITNYLKSLKEPKHE